MVIHNKEEALINDDYQLYFLKAIDLLQGKKPFLCNRTTINNCIEFLDKAYAIEQLSLIDYFRAYIEYDYFERKHLKRQPNYEFYLERANKRIITQNEIDWLEKKLNNKIQFGG